MARVACRDDEACAGMSARRRDVEHLTGMEQPLYKNGADPNSLDETDRRATNDSPSPVVDPGACLRKLAAILVNMVPDPSRRRITPGRRV
jgi:hypothetical protein